MSDEWVMVPRDLLQRVDAALQRHLDRHAPMRIPVDQTDSDLVQSDVQALISAPAAPQQAEPVSDEWVTVPREPTDEMVIRGAESLHDNGIRFETDGSEPQHDLAADTYRKMLDAAPQQAEPVAWVRPDQLKQASQGRFLCSLGAKQLADDMVPLYLHPPAAEVQRLRDALENVRLLAARHRKEEWAGHMLRFCADAGVTGSSLREGGE